VVAGGDALGELPQVIPRQEVAQFFLTNQDDLQQLLFGGLEIGQQADLLQSGWRKVLCLIDDEDRSAAFGMCFEQVSIQGVG